MLNNNSGANNLGQLVVSRFSLIWHLRCQDDRLKTRAKLEYKLAVMVHLSMRIIIMRLLSGIALLSLGS